MKMDINKLVRQNILRMKPYSSARDEYTGRKGVFLDANENPYGKLNRYPDPHQHKLKKKLAKLKSLSEENIFIGNGSDEVIDLTLRIFCNPGKDKAIIFTPTYGMYEVSANINDIELIKIELDESFQIDLKKLEKTITDKRIKIIFICSPNNPSANNIKYIEMILKMFNGIVLIDEAYIDFTDFPSYINKIGEYPNLVVSQTFSKARGLAAARVGVAYAGKEIISLLNKVKPPYNVSELNQKAALKSLQNISDYKENKANILKQKKWLEKELLLIPVIIKIFPSDSNFFLVETTNADKIYNELIKNKIITRNRNTVVKNCIRITVGSPAENKKLINALKTISQ